MFPAYIIIRPGVEFKYKGLDQFTNELEKARVFSTYQAAEKYVVPSRHDQIVELCDEESRLTGVHPLLLRIEAAGLHYFSLRKGKLYETDD